MNVGIVGLGKMGILHAGIVNSLSGSGVTAVCEKERFLVLAAKTLLPKTIAVYNDPCKMLEEEELDAVYVTTPIDTHVPIVIELLKFNKDLSLFVEKPLASSEREARLACEAANRSQGVQMVGFQKRFSRVFQKARELVQENILGDPIFFRSYCFSSDVLREGHAWRFRKNTGGVLLDLAPHLLDLLIWYFGEPNVIWAAKKKVYSSEVEDYVHATMSFESGVEGHMDACWSISNFRLPEISIEIHGTNGMLVITDDHVTFAPGRGTSQIGGSRTYHKQSFNMSAPFLLADPEYAMEDAAFLDSVRTRTMPESNLAQAAKVNLAIDKILVSAERRGMTGD